MLSLIASRKIQCRRDLINFKQRLFSFFFRFQKITLTLPLLLMLSVRNKLLLCQMFKPKLFRRVVGEKFRFRVTWRRSRKDESRNRKFRVSRKVKKFNFHFHFHFQFWKNWESEWFLFTRVWKYGMIWVGGKRVENISFLKKSKRQLETRMNSEKISSIKNVYWPHDAKQKLTEKKGK